MLTLALLMMAAVAGAETVAYSLPAAGPLELDVFAGDGAKAKAAGRRPAVIVLHGGELISGSRRDPELNWLIQPLGAAGYVVFSANYRLAPRDPYPAALDDVQKAIRFVRANAERWQVDPKRIALAGIKAGGYLASFAAASSPPRVRAVISVAGTADLRGWPITGAFAQFLGPLIESKGLEAALAEASPVMHIRVGAPPFLLIHGDEDRIMPPVQATHWQNALQAAGVACNLILVSGGGHDVAGWQNLRDWQTEMLAWLSAALAPGRAAKAGR